jgi:hypothetical protein
MTTPKKLPPPLFTMTDDFHRTCGTKALYDTTMAACQKSILLLSTTIFANQMGCAVFFMPQKAHPQ